MFGRRPYSHLGPIAGVWPLAKRTYGIDSWGVAPGYGDYGLRPKVMLVLFRALPQATVMMAFGQVSCSIVLQGRCPRLR